MTNTLNKGLCECSGPCVHVFGDEGTVRAVPVDRRSSLSDDDLVQPEAMDPSDEDRFVRSVLARAAGERGGVEFAGVANVQAYASLAEQRGVSLERVARAVARGELASIVRLPYVPPEKRTKS